MDEDVAAHAVAQQVLHLAQVLADDRAGLGAAGEEEVDQDHAVVDQIGIEAEGLPVLVDHRRVGDAHAVLGRGRPGPGRCQGTHRRTGQDGGSGCRGALAEQYSPFHALDSGSLVEAGRASRAHRFP